MKYPIKLIQLIKKHKIANVQYIQLSSGWELILKDGMKLLRLLTSSGSINAVTIVSLLFLENSYATSWLFMNFYSAATINY